MRGLISLLVAALFVYLGYYVYTHLDPKERDKVVEYGKKGVDEVGDAVTKGAKAVLKHVPDGSSSAPAK